MTRPGPRPFVGRARYPSKLRPSAVTMTGRSICIACAATSFICADLRSLMNKAGIVKPPQITPAFQVSIALENSQIVLNPTAFDRSHAIKGGQLDEIIISVSDVLGIGLEVENQDRNRFVAIGSIIEPVDALCIRGKETPDGIFVVPRPIQVDRISRERKILRIVCRQSQTGVAVAKCQEIERR